MTSTKQRSTRPSTKTTKTEKPVDTANKERHVGKLIPIDNIQLPLKQPRRSFNQTKLEQLTESVRKFGILEPLIVRPLSEDVFELVAGERRYKAATEVGLLEVPVVIRQMTEKEAFELALLENLQRDDLNPVDETEGLLDLLCESLDLSRQEVISIMNKAANAERKHQIVTDNVIRNYIEKIDSIFLTVGRTSRESFRSNRLPLLNLPPDVLEFLRDGRLEYTKAKVIAKIEDRRMRKKLMRETVEAGLSLKAVKQRVSELLSDDPNGGGETTLKDELQAIARIKSNAWNDKRKQKKLKTLLSEVRAVLASES